MALCVFIYVYRSVLGSLLFKLRIMATLLCFLCLTSETVSYRSRGRIHSGECFSYTASYRQHNAFYGGFRSFYTAKRITKYNNLPRIQSFNFLLYAFYSTLPTSLLLFFSSQMLLLLFCCFRNRLRSSQNFQCVRDGALTL